MHSKKFKRVSAVLHKKDRVRCVTPVFDVNQTDTHVFLPPDDSCSRRCLLCLGLSGGWGGGEGGKGQEEEGGGGAVNFTSVPAPAMYQSHSSDIIDVLADLLDKAQAELDDTRFAVTNTAHNFAMLKQSIGDQLAQVNNALDKDMADKSELATAGDSPSCRGPGEFVICEGVSGCHQGHLRPSGLGP